MVAYAWKGIVMALVLLGLLMGCASSPYVGTGAVLGGGVGALSGAAIAGRNPWAGALVGGVLGSALGAAGGYALQQRQQPYGPTQGYYYQPQPGYRAPAPPAYGSYESPPASSPGPSYGYHQAPAPAPPPNSAPGNPYEGWEFPEGAPPPLSQGSGNGPGGYPAYSQAPPPRGGVPVTPAPYVPEQNLD